MIFASRFLQHLVCILILIEHLILSLVYIFLLSTLFVDTSVWIFFYYYSKIISRMSLIITYKCRIES